MAQNIIGPVRNALSLLRVSVQESRIFNPLQAVKTYRISMTDLTEAVILPPLFQRLRRLAPTVIIESFLSKRRETTKELAAGRLDFAVDAPLNTDPQVRHVKLMEDRYVCAMRKGHPLAGKEKLTLDDYLSPDPHPYFQPPQRPGLCRPGAGQDGHPAQDRPALPALPDGLASVAADRHGHDRAGTLRPPP